MFSTLTSVVLASVFSPIELISIVAFALVAKRLGLGDGLVKDTLDVFLISFSSLVCFVCAMVALASENGALLALILILQSMADLVCAWLSYRAQTRDLIRGSLSNWRGVIASAELISALVFMTDSQPIQIVGAFASAFRMIWVAQPKMKLFMKSKSSSSPSTFDDEEFILDEWGLLRNRPAIHSSSFYLSFDGTRDFDAALRARQHGSDEMISGLSTSLLAQDPSFITDVEEVPGRSSLRVGAFGRTSSASTSESVDSVHLTGSAAASWIGSGHIRLNPDATGVGRFPASPIDTDLLNMLPHTVQVVGWREVLTAGGVALIVYVLRTDQNGICVHRYGDFRALCNRHATKMFSTSEAEPPSFPSRRVFRKLLPEAMGGISHTDSANREFISNRAAGLGEWSQKVLDFVHRTKPPPPLVYAMLDFFKPILRHTPDADLQIAIQSAVVVFSDTVLNPVVLTAPGF